MELLDSINQPFYEDTTGLDLYYGSYRYRVKAKIVGIERTRYTHTVEKFNKLVLNRAYRLYYSSSSIADTIVDEGGNLDTLSAYIDWRNVVKGLDIKLILTRNHLTMYFNDVGVLSGLLPILGTTRLICNYRVKHNHLSKDTIYRVNPKYSWRMYFTGHVLNFVDVERMEALFDTYGVEPCRSLKRNFSKIHRATWPKHDLYVYENNFVDYNDERLSTIILLNWPTISKKICRIERR